MTPRVQRVPGRLGGSPTDPEILPLLYPSHRGLAPTIIQVCGMDPLHSEDLLYESLLKSEGVKTKLTVYPGVPHQQYHPLKLILYYYYRVKMGQGV